MKSALMAVATIASLAAVGGVVSVPDGAEPSSFLARDEFTNYVCRITGRVDACPDTVIGTVKTLGSRIPAAAAKALAKTENIEASWTGFDGKTLWFVGKNEVAELYAVYHFLESKLGVRWFQAKTKEDPGEYVPKMPRVELKSFEEFREPKFRIRMLEAMHCYGSVPATNAQTCAVRNGFQVNAPYGRIDYEKPNEPNTGFYAPRVPHRLTNLGGDHLTFAGTCPAKKWFATHPEYFALVNGKRKPGQQYCISNPGLRQAVVDRIIAALDRDGGNGQWVFGMVDTTYGWCECPDCVALDDPAEQGRGTPNVARRFAISVNDMAAKVWAKYPKADLRMWAYHTYRKRAKDVAIDPRMKICFCDHGRCYGHALDDPKCLRNANIHKMLKDWMASGNQVYVYAYLLCTSPQYTCNEMMQADDIRKYVKLGIMGWKEEGSYSDARFVNQKATGLRDIQPSNWQWCYVTSHMLWDPTLDEKALVDDAESKYYGAAYPAMKKYHAFRRRLWENNPACMGYPKGDLRRPQLLDVPGSKERLLALLDQADSLAGSDDVLKFRLARDRRWLETYWIKANEKRRATASRPIFCAVKSEEPVSADGRISEKAWGASVYSDFGDRTVGAVYEGKTLSFYLSGRGTGHVVCLYPPAIDNRRYRFEVAADGRVACEVNPGGRVSGAFGASATVRKSKAGEMCEISIPVGQIHALRSGDTWQVMFGSGGACADWRDGSGYSAMTIGAPFSINGSFSDLDEKGMPKGWCFGDAGGEVVKEGIGNAVSLKGKMFATMTMGELGQRPYPRRIRFSFRAKGDGAIRVMFYRYTESADSSNPDRFKKNTYKRTAQYPHGSGGSFNLTPQMSVYSGEYTIAANEWCAIAFYRAKSKTPPTIADVSVVMLEGEERK